jgi:hypothetical protein
MDITGFAIIVLVLGVASLVLRPEVAVICMMCLCLANAAGTISIGGASIPPANLFLVFFTGRLVLQRRGLWDAYDALRSDRTGIWLLLLMSYAVMSAVFYPRLLEGATDIFFTDRLFPTNHEALLRPLAPGSGNITQSIYALGAVCVYAATQAYRQTVSPEIFLKGFLALALLNIAFAVLDIVTYNMGIGFVLDLMRSGGYVIHAGQDFGGYRRLIGSFTEPSSFAAFSFVMFVAMFVLWLKRWGGALVVVAMLSNLALVAMSTSTTGYGALAVFGGVVAVWLVFLLLSERITKRALTIVLALWIGATFTVTLHAAGLVPAGVYEVADLTIGKAQSASGIERSMMNARAWANFVETGGLGVGLGSARASSFVLVLLSNLGVIGALLFVMFLLRLLLANPRRGEGILAAVGKSQILALFTVSSISGGVFDLGVLFYFCCGLVADTGRTAGVTGRRG